MSDPRRRAGSGAAAPRALLLLALAGAASPPAAGQPVVGGEEHLSFDRTEAWAMQYVASANLVTALGAPRALEPGAVELTAEGIWIPSLSEEERRVGFNGNKVEDLNRTDLFPRPRLLVGLPSRFTLEVSYVPPIEAFDLEPHLGAVALGRPIVESPRGRVGLRLFAQYGTLEGDFTCPDEEAAAGDDPVRNPFGCEAPSRDEMTLRNAGLEISGALHGASLGRFEPYAAIGVTHMDLDFQVDARYAGIIDRALLLAEGETFYFALGTVYRAGPRWRWALELFYSPLDVIRPPETEPQTDALLNARWALTYRLR